MSHTERHPTVPSTPEGITEDGITSREAALARVLESRAEAGTAQRPTLTPEASQGSAERSGFGWKKPIAAVALLAAGAGIFGATRGGEEPTSGSEREPSASATQNPGETSGSDPETAETPETGVAEYGFSTAEYTNNPELLMTDFVEQVNQLRNSGYTPELRLDPRRGEYGDDIAFAAEVAAEHDAAFATAVFPEEWGTYPNLVEYFDTTTYIHTDVLATAIKTTPGENYENEEQYQRFIDIVPGSVSAEATPEGNVVGSFDYTGRDNRDKNVAEDVVGEGEDVNTMSGSYDLTFANINGELKLVDVVVE